MEAAALYHTLCPVPVGLVTRVVAFLTEGGVKILDERTVPREELASEVDLSRCETIEPRNEIEKNVRRD